MVVIHETIPTKRETKRTKKMLGVLATEVAAQRTADKEAARGFTMPDIKLLARYGISVAFSEVSPEAWRENALAQDPNFCDPGEAGRFVMPFSEEALGRDF